MDKKLLILLLGIPVISIAIIRYLPDSADLKQTIIAFPQKNSQQKIADTFFNNADIINYGETGSPKSRIIGDQLFHYPGNEDSEISAPRITLFRENDSPVTITADHGWINQEGTRVLLKGHTIIRREASQTNQFSQLEAPELIIWPNDEFVETDKAVKITTDSGIASGTGMKAYLDQEHYYLLNNVKSKHLPVKKRKK